MGRHSRIYIKLNFNIKSTSEELWETNLHGTRQCYQIMLCLCSIMFHVKALNFYFLLQKSCFLMTLWEKHNQDIFVLNVGFHELQLHGLF
jgi:hypothetical protein